MNKKVGFIGCGNMGSAMVGGLIKSKFLEADDIIVSTKTEESAKKLKDQFGIETTLDSKLVAKEADAIILAVKPFMYKEMISKIKSELSKDKLIITIAAGISISNMEEWIGENAKIIRTMPNTPALVGQAMSAVCPNGNISNEELNYCVKIFQSFGECVQLEEKDFHAFTALCGSSPAYVYMFIEAMADAAVKLGIPRVKAYKMSAQSVLGSSKMVLETGKHPGELKDAVCSPAGTTIEAVVELERLGFRNSVIQAIDKCAEKSKNM
ncbi:pyrroline-5-carboxylate reductase [uncultured Clostridium sp.]|uniref:pyrroline-5-carboxylate reductase n=1 Tax=uncultured Clostridium sp. TaxID=59620 RepID=UPI0028E33C4C|nr:pyrroline-5-carboxylate reductase [uncultured Clostridium sp.]